MTHLCPLELGCAMWFSWPMKREAKPHVVLLGTSLKCQIKICYSFGPFPQFMKVMTRASSLACIPKWWWLVEPLCWSKIVMSCIWDNLFLCFKPPRYLSWGVGVCVHTCVCAQRHTMVNMTTHTVIFELSHCFYPLQSQPITVLICNWSNHFSNTLHVQKITLWQPF